MHTDVHAVVKINTFFFCLFESKLFLELSEVAPGVVRETGLDLQACKFESFVLHPLDCVSVFGTRRAEMGSTLWEAEGLMCAC